MATINESKFIKHNNYYFVESNNIKVFPCAYRGYSSTGNSPLVFDPEARSTTEANFTKTYHQISPNKTSYIVSWTGSNSSEGTLTLVLGGYYFEINNCKATDFIGSDNTEYSVYINLKNQALATSSSDTNRTTEVLSSYSNSEDYLDFKIPNTENYIFVGLAISNIADSDISYSYKLTPFKAVLDENNELTNIKLNYSACALPNLLDTGTGDYSIRMIEEISTGTDMSTVASGNYAVAFGHHSEASGDTSFATGFETKAAGENSLAGGYKAEATGKQSVALGNDTTATGDNSFALGINTTASGAQSVSLGNNTIASGNNSLAIGSTLEAKGTNSIATGIGTKAEGSYSYAGGYQTKATKEGSYAIGKNTEATGEYSVATGENTKADHKNSQASGLYTKTGGENQTVIGKYNTGNSDTLFEIGNGSESARSNALEVETNKTQIRTDLEIIPNNETSCMTIDSADILINPIDNVEISTDCISMTAKTDATVNIGETNTNKIKIDSTTLEIKNLASKTVTIPTISTITSKVEIKDDTTESTDSTKKIEIDFDSSKLKSTIPVEMTNTLKVSGNTSLENTLTVKKATTIDDALTVKKATTLKDSLTVDKATTLKDNLSVTKNTNIGGTLDITGNTSIKSDLEVTGNTTLKGTLSTKESITSDKNISLTSTTGITHTLTLGSSINKDAGEISIYDKTTAATPYFKLSCKETTGGTLDLTGNIKIKPETYTKAQPSGEDDFAGALVVKNGGLVVRGNFIMGSNSAESGDNTVAGNTTVQGNIYIVDPNNVSDNKIKLLTNGNVEVAGSLTVSTVNLNNINVAASETGEAQTSTIYGINFKTPAEEAKEKRKHTSIENIYNLNINNDMTVGSSIKLLGSTGFIEGKVFNAISDIRKKTNIKDYRCEKSILDLPLKSFEYINDESHTKYIGCIAQDLQEICPEIVNKDSEGYLSIQESKLVYLLLQEVKELKEKVELLERR